MNAAEREDNEKSEIRVKLESAMERARDVCERLEEKTAAAARATDKAVHEHPYQAIGLAFGLGLLTGVLVMWRRRD
ncbi:MAG TPA: DUF883 domain-containing protein [Verrucomicrobiae bacterium]|nr:DUF883 domain-containing protein [Verrucomicrobiae bacterium]